MGKEFLYVNFLSKTTQQNKLKFTTEIDSQEQISFCSNISQ